MRKANVKTIHMSPPPQPTVVREIETLITAARRLPAVDEFEEFLKLLMEQTMKGNIDPLQARLVTGQLLLWLKSKDLHFQASRSGLAAKYAEYLAEAKRDLKLAAPAFQENHK